MTRRLLTLTLVTLALLAPAREAAAAQGSQDARPPVVATPAPVNLNTADAAALEKLPGIGPAMAARIIEYRQKNGSFKKVEELMNVRGIGEATFLKLKPLVTVSPPKTEAR